MLTGYRPSFSVLQQPVNSQQFEKIHKLAKHSGATINDLLMANIYPWITDRISLGHNFLSSDYAEKLGPTTSSV
jgi:hypothetical protein